MHTYICLHHIMCSGNQYVWLSDAVVIVAKWHGIVIVIDVIDFFMWNFYMILT